MAAYPLALFVTSHLVARCACMRAVGLGSFVSHFVTSIVSIHVVVVCTMQGHSELLDLSESPGACTQRPAWYQEAARAVPTDLCGAATARAWHTHAHNVTTRSQNPWLHDADEACWHRVDCTLHSICWAPACLCLLGVTWRNLCGCNLDWLCAPKRVKSQWVQRCFTCNSNSPEGGYKRELEQ